MTDAFKSFWTNDQNVPAKKNRFKHLLLLQLQHVSGNWQKHKKIAKTTQCPTHFPGLNTQF